MNLQNLCGSVSRCGPPGLWTIRTLTAKYLKRQAAAQMEAARCPWTPVCLILILGFWPSQASAQGTEVSVQNPITWRQVKARFEATNPTLKAAQLGIDE